MKYPLKIHKTGGFFPASGKCGHCGNSNNGKFVTISFGAQELIAPKTLVPAKVETTFSLIDHGVTESGKHLTVFKNVNDAFFCSTDCLRQFLNQVVTDFERGEV